MTDAADLLASSPLFDEDFYAAQVGRPLTRAQAVAHYLDTGAQAGLMPGPLFDPVAYAASGSPARRPLVRYLRRHQVRRRVHACFDQRAYLAAHPESADHPSGPAGHWLEVGRASGWRPNDWLPDGVDLLDWLAERRREAAIRPPAPAVWDAPEHGEVTLVVHGLPEHPQPVDTVVWCDSDRVEDHVVADAAALRSPGTTVVHGGLEAALAAATGRVLVLLDGDAAPARDWLAPLAAALGDDDVSAAQPVVLDRTGAIAHAGLDGAGRPLLAGWPREDARSLGGQPVPAISGALALRRRDVQAARGLPAATGRLVVVPESAVTTAGTLSLRGDAPTPRLERVSQRPDRLRWAIKNPAPAAPIGDQWGDTPFAHAIAAALRDLGQEVVVDRREAFHRGTRTADDVSLTLRGLHPYEPADEIALCWVISHPDLLTAEEASRYDRVLVASTTWQPEGVVAEPLLQATDPARFHPDLAAPDSGAEVLFVGSSRGQVRPVVRDAVAVGLPLTVYGRGWEGLVPDAAVAATFLDNARVGAAYRAAGVVLNDHWADMRRDGFLSNRLFDAVAAGARVITDDVAGLGDLFGRAVQVYEKPDHLRRLASPEGLDERFGDDAERRATAARIAREHSFAARARRLLDVALEVRAARGA